MAVDVDRDFDAVMPELIPDVGKGLTSLNEKACVSVSQIMDLDLPQSCLLESLIEDPPPPVIDIYQSPITAGENPLGWFLCSSIAPGNGDHNLPFLIFEGLQSLGQLQAHINPSALAVLGGFDFTTRNSPVN